MPAERLSMRKIKEVLRLSWCGRLSSRAVARSCGIGRTTVREYLYRAKEAGLAWPLPEGMTDGELEELLFDLRASGRGAGVRPLPDWGYVHGELKRKGVTLFLLWEEYKSVHPEGYEYSRFCDLHREWSGKLPVWMRQSHKAGEKLFVDYAGMTMPVVDPETGMPREAQIFVAAMGASNYTYAEATWTQSIPDFLASHVRALEFFGGVVEILVPDNLKSGVTNPCRYDPDVNPSYYELVSHYGAAIMPARVAKPKDKAKVEVGVQGVERRILARLRNRTFLSLAELNEAIRPLLDEYNDRPFQRLEGSRRSVFEKVDRPALRPLPSRRYEYAEWVKARVNLDYHVRADDNNYSVPYRLVKRQLDVRITVSTIEVFDKGKRVASHARIQRDRNRYSTSKDHMPEHHRQHAEWTPERVIGWVGRSGPATAELAVRIIKSRPHPEQGYRACMGIKRLGQQYGAERLEAACARALAIQSPSYKSVKSILKTGLDRQPLPDNPDDKIPGIKHENVRGAQYYRN